MSTRPPAGPDPSSRVLLFAWLGWLAVFFTLISFFQLSLLYRIDLGLDDQGVKVIKSIALAMTGVGGVALGVLADAIGRKPAMMISIVIYALGAACAAFSHSLGALELCAAVAGIGIGGQWAAGQTLLAETVPSARRGRFGALAQTGAPLGLGLATLVATEFAPRFGWRAAFGLAAAPVLLTAWIAAALPESPVWLAHRASGEPRRSSLAALLGPGIRRPFAIAFVLTLFNMTSYWLTTSWLPEFVGRQWHLTIQKTGAWTLVFVAGSLAGYAFYGVASDHWGRRVTFSVCSAVMAIGLSMITVFERSIRDHPALILAFLFTAGVGTGTWSGFGALYAELFPTRVRNTASGACMNLSRAAQFVAPLLVVAVGGTTLGPGVALAAAFAVLAGIWIWLLPETRGRAVA
ncbi:MAG TPA: MFS transporter [Candidatus Udaeobacter sp.]|jgi:MFS family permease|nr:MFS transporter [Candidatus Udaeobacter sp.]